MRLAALAVALVLSGCFHVASVLTVHTDGSALLRDEVTLSGMALLALQDAGDDGTPLFSRAEMATRADALGEGVRLLSFDARDDGYTAIYAVDDVRRIAYAAPTSGADSDATAGLGLSFGFDAGDPSVLRVFVPKPPLAKPSPESADEVDRATQAQALDMVRGFLDDARVTVAVEVEGAVIDTNASVVDGSRVVVYDVPFDVLFDAMEADPALGAGGPPTPAAVLGPFRDVDGLTIPAPGTIRVRFR